MPTTAYCSACPASGRRPWRQYPGLVGDRRHQRRPRFEDHGDPYATESGLPIICRQHHRWPSVVPSTGAGNRHAQLDRCRCRLATSILWRRRASSMPARPPRVSGNVNSWRRCKPSTRRTFGCRARRVVPPVALGLVDRRLDQCQQRRGSFAAGHGTRPVNASGHQPSIIIVEVLGYGGGDSDASGPGEETSGDGRRRISKVITRTVRFRSSGLGTFDA